MSKKGYLLFLLGISIKRPVTYTNLCLIKSFAYLAIHHFSIMVKGHKFSPYLTSSNHNGNNDHQIAIK